MRAAAPLASSFIAYILGLSVFTLVFRFARERFRKSKYLIAAMFALIGMLIGVWTITHNTNIVMANVKLQGPQTGNEPIGEAKGIFPGRVVWEYNPDATNKNMTNTAGDYWFDDKNTDQSVVNQMLSDGLKLIANATTDPAAWDSIFHYYNRAHGRGDVGYTAGEKIAIKVNYNAGGGGPGINTSPQINYALLDQLINKAGVAQANIGIGDHTSTPDENYNKCHAAFPNVNYWNSLALATTEPLKTSDGQLTIHLPQVYIDATYMINMPVLKKHHRAGISLCSKNHNGSVCPDLGSAFPVHYSLPCPDADGQASNGAYGSYRIFVDFMGCSNLGGKTILYAIDGIWSSVNYAHPPINGAWLHLIMTTQIQFLCPRIR